MGGQSGQHRDRSLGLRQMRGKLTQLSSAHSGDVIELHIDEDVAGEEEHAFVERCGQRSYVFDAHEGLAIEGEGGVSAGSIFESRGFHRDGAVVMLVGGHFKIGEAILFEYAGGGAVDLARIGAKLRRAAELPTGKGLGQNRGGRLGLRKQGGAAKNEAKKIASSATHKDRYRGFMSWNGSSTY